MIKLILLVIVAAIAWKNRDAIKSWFARTKGTEGE